MCLNLIFNMSFGPFAALHAQDFPASDFNLLSKGKQNNPRLGYNNNTGGELNVHVSGEVANPGEVYMRPNQRVLQAIELAGGFSGSAAQNRVELRRSGRTTRLNMFKVKRQGILAENPAIQEGDLIFVPFMNQSVRVQGPVRYPDVYEIHAEMNLKDLVELAGGTTVGLAQDKPAIVVRFDSDNKVQSLEVPLSEAAHFELKDGDVITLPHKLISDRHIVGTVDYLPNDRMDLPSYTKEVFVLGGVKKPTKLPFLPQQSLAMYVAQAGGLTRLGREDVIIYRQNQEPFKALVQSQIPILPGDTLVVGEDYLGPEFWITFMTSLAGLGLSIVAVFGR